MPTYNDSALTYDAGTTSYDGDPGAIPGLPQCVIEIGFDDGPYVSEPYWTDVTEYVRAVTVRRGRSDDLSPFVGTATVELDNRDRRFDPFNTSSVYNGKLVPRRQIRIRAAAGASTYPVFRGYVAGWPVSYTDAGFDSTVTVECFDALAFVAAETTPDTWLSYYTLSLNPTHYWKMDEPFVAQVGAGYPGSLLTVPFKDYGSDPQNIIRVLGQINPQSDYFSGIPHGSVLSSNLGIGTANDTIPPAPVTGTSMSIFIRANVTESWQFNVSSGGAVGMVYNASTRQLLAFGLVSTGATSTKNTSISYQFAGDQPAHIVISISSAGDLKVYINGEDKTGTITTSSGTLPTDQRINLADVPAQEWSVFNKVLTQAEVQTLYYYGSLDFQEQIQSRLTRLFRTTPFPENASPPGDFNIWEAPLATQFVRGLQSDNPISSELAVLNSGEGGELFTSREGVIYLTGRDTQNYSDVRLPYDPVTPQVTFSDQAGTALLPFGPSLDVEYNADDIINDLSVTFTGGGSIAVSDTGSINENGKRSATITTSLTGPTGAGSPQDLAANRLEYFRHVIPKVSPLDVGMTRRLTDWQRILDLELMDCFSVQRTPSVGSALDFRLLVQAIEHQVVPGDWRVRITGSARYSNWFTADVDFADGDRLAV